MKDVKLVFEDSRIMEVYRGTTVREVLNEINKGVVIKVKEEIFNSGVIIYYSDKTALIKYNNGRYVKVLALNNFEDRIYYIDDYGMIEIIEENINKSNAKQDKIFSLKEIKNLVIKRKFSDIIKYLKTDEKQVGDLNHGR